MVMRLSDKGFFLLDALLSVFIVSIICIMCFTIYNLMDRYDKGYRNYQTISNEHYVQIFNGLAECEECETDEPD